MADASQDSTAISPAARLAVSQADFQIAADLFRELMIREYGISPERSFVKHLDLPGEYAPPDGAVLLAFDGARAAGCVGLRRLEDGVCEMKRLYVRSEARGRGLGRLLTEELAGIAIARGYRTMRLLTVARMTPAVELYRSLGFVEIPHYTDDLPPEHDVVSMELCLEKHTEV